MPNSEDNIFSLLFRSVEEDQIDDAKILLEALLKKNPLRLEGHVNSRSLISLVIEKYSLFFPELFEVQKYNTELMFEKDGRGRTLVWYAAQEDHTTIIKELLTLKKQDSPQVYLDYLLMTDMDGVSALHIAARKGLINTVQMLLRQILETITLMEEQKQATNQDEKLSQILKDIKLIEEKKRANQSINQDEEFQARSSAAQIISQRIIKERTINERMADIVKKPSRDGNTALHMVFEGRFSDIEQAHFDDAIRTMAMLLTHGASGNIHNDRGIISFSQLNKLHLPECFKLFNLMTDEARRRTRLLIYYKAEFQKDPENIEKKALYVNCAQRASLKEKLLADFEVKDWPINHYLHQRQNQNIPETLLENILPRELIELLPTYFQKRRIADDLLTKTRTPITATNLLSLSKVKLKPVLSTDAENLEYLDADNNALAELINYINNCIALWQNPSLRNKILRCLVYCAIAAAFASIVTGGYFVGDITKNKKDHSWNIIYLIGYCLMCLAGAAIGLRGGHTAGRSISAMEPTIYAWEFKSLLKEIQNVLLNNIEGLIALEQAEKQRILKIEETQKGKSYLSPTRYLPYDDDQITVDLKTDMEKLKARKPLSQAIAIAKQLEVTIKKIRDEMNKTFRPLTLPGTSLMLFPAPKPGESILDVIPSAKPSTSRFQEITDEDDENQPLLAGLTDEQDNAIELQRVTVHRM